MACSYAPMLGFLAFAATTQTVDIGRVKWKFPVDK